MKYLAYILVFAFLIWASTSCSIYQYHVCRENVCHGDGCFWYCMQHIK